MTCYSHAVSLYPKYEVSCLVRSEENGVASDIGLVVRYEVKLNIDII